MDIPLSTFEGPLRQIAPESLNDVNAGLSAQAASCRMRISTLDISGITTTVRRHEALLRYARYLFIFNLAIFLWVVFPQFSR